MCSAHIACMCLAWISEQTSIISLNSINWLVFVTEADCLLWGFSNKIEFRPWRVNLIVLTNQNDCTNTCHNLWIFTTCPEAYLVMSYILLLRGDPTSSCSRKWQTRLRSSLTWRHISPNSSRHLAVRTASLGSHRLHRGHTVYDTSVWLCTTASDVFWRAWINPSIHPQFIWQSYRN